jgi:AcrR family transcriptional regulator
VADAAGTSVASVYELFGDKAGLLRDMFFEGFRLLAISTGSVTDTDDPLADLEGLIGLVRRFGREQRVLAELMFSRPFADFDPGPQHLLAGEANRELIVGHVRRCTEAGRLGGDPTDIAHVVLALAQGLVTQESAGWLGSSAASIDRRWDLATRAVLCGLAPL